MATETIERVETCGKCKYWDKEWFRKPEDDEGKGLRFCNVRLYHINDKGIKVYELIWGNLLTRSDSVLENGERCRGFEAKDGN